MTGLGGNVPSRDGVETGGEAFTRLGYGPRAMGRWQTGEQWWRTAALAGMGLPVAAAISAVAVRPTGSAGDAAAPKRPAVVLSQPDPLASFAAPDDAAPTHGTTGTVAPPPEPVAVAGVDPGEATVTPALPFSAARASALDRGRALECLTAAIYYEAASESDDGERAVAQVVLNRVRHPAFPATVCGVVYQGSEKHGCQFSFACDGSMARARSRTGWARAMRFAAEALAGQVFAAVGLATHYHTYAVTPAWNRAMVMTDAVGAHFFHRWKGYWGTAAAFRRAYIGGEPMPGPHAPLVEPVPIPTSPVVVAAIASPPVTPAPSVQPAHADSGATLATPAPSSLPDSPVLDRWKDAGKPLK